MTNKEVQDKIKRAESKEWFKTIKVSFDYTHLNIHIEKEGFFDIYQYVKRQCREWDKITFKLPNTLKYSKDSFNILLNNLDSFVNNYLNESESLLNSQWSSISNEIRGIGQNQRFPIDAPITSFLIEAHKISPQHYQGAYNYLIDANRWNVTTKNQFAGAIMAYEFQFEDSTKIPKRRNAERSSNATIRNHFEKYFTETTQNVNSFFAKS